MSLPDTIKNIIARSESEGNFETAEYKYADSVYWATFGRRNEWKSHSLDTAEANSNSYIYNYMWGPSEFTALGTLKNYDRVEALSEIKVPTLFIAGEYDEARKPTVNFLSKMVPNSQTVFIPNAGHSSMTDNSKEYNQAIKHFLMKIKKD
jgi:proline iminopeptidase